MENIYIGFGIMILIYLLYLLIIISNERRLEKYINNSRETNLLKHKYKIKYDKVNHKFVVKLIALANSFIIGLTFIIVMLIKGRLIKFVIAFVIFVILIILSYSLIGKIIKRKEEK